MCLAIPGRVVSISGDEPFSKMGKVNFAGIVKEISLAYVPEANVGDYVIVHVGFAISKIDEREAERVFDYLRKMDELAQLEDQEAEPSDERREAL